MIEQALSGVLPPLLITLLALWLRKRCDFGEAATRSVCAASLAIGFFVAGTLLDKLPLPPIDAKTWLLCSVGAIGILVLLARGPLILAVGGVTLLTVGARVLLGGSPEPTHPWKGWDLGNSNANWLSCAGVMLASWIVIAMPRRTQPGALPLLIVSGTAGTSAYVLMEGGNASVAQYVGALAIGLLCLAIAAGRGVPVRLDSQIGLVCATVLGGCLIVGKYFADTDTLATVLVLSIPLSLWVSAHGSLRDRPLRRWILGGGSFALLAGLAAWRTFAMAPEGYDY